MEENLRVRKFVVEEIQSADGIMVYIASSDHFDCDSHEKLIEYLETILSMLKNSETTFVYGHIQKAFFKLSPKS